MVTARGILSFEDFQLALDKRITVVVGPNGAGKSNLGRVLELVSRAVENADRMSQPLGHLLDVYLAGRRAHIPAGGIDIRVKFELTDDFERQLVIAFVQAAAGSALLGSSTGVDTSNIEGWVQRHMTERKLSPLFQSPGTWNRANPRRRCHPLAWRGEAHERSFLGFRGWITPPRLSMSMYWSSFRLRVCGSFTALSR
jgi:hypothetical protein